jgi:hypothetical protein
MTRKWMIGALALWLVVPAAVYAHAGHVHRIMGTVMAHDEKHLEVKTPSGEVLSIAVTEKTFVTRAKKKVALAELQAGRRVVVDIGDGEDPLIAGEIQLGAAKPATK